MRARSANPPEEEPHPAAKAVAYAPANRWAERTSQGKRVTGPQGRVSGATADAIVLATARAEGAPQAVRAEDAMGRPAQHQNPRPPMGMESMSIRLYSGVLLRMRGLPVDS